MRELKVIQGGIPHIEMTYRHLHESNIQNAVSKILNCPAIPQKPAYWFARVNQKLEAQVKDISKEYTDLVLSYAEKDEKGEPKRSEKNPAEVVIMKDKQAEFDKKCEEFFSKTLKIEINKLQASDFDKVSLTPKDLLALEPILHGLE